jgi:hypothetical protein
LPTATRPLAPPPAGTALARLEALLGGEPISEEASLEEWPAVHERYAEAFGVDPEIGRRAWEQHPLT